MKKDFNLDDFESFLSDSVEEHRMYPSDRVWRNIDNELHEKKRWPALTFFSILFGSIITVGIVLIQPNKNLFTINIPAQAAGNAGAKQLSATTASPTETNAAANGPQQVDIGFSSFGVASTTGQQQAAYPISDVNKAGTDYYVAEADWALQHAIETAISTTKASLGNAEFSIGQANRASKPDDAYADIAGSGEIIGSSLVSVTQNQLPTVNMPLVTVANSVARLPVAKNIITKKNSIFALAKKAPAQRWSFTMYATPSYSYRILKEVKREDKDLPVSGPVSPSVTLDVNDFVRHKPRLGLEAGAGFIYNVTQNFRIKAGLQFNYRHYAIEAYASSFQATTILLNQGSTTESLVGFTSISNRRSPRPLTVSNQYWQVGVPVGFDMKLSKWKRLNVFVGGTIQPTYQFNKNNIYLLSSDYKNYIQKPELIRVWNINTSIEAFLAYKVGKGITLQAGPQMQYQMLPGSIDQYPIRENLVNYGVKVGIVKILK